MPWQDHAACRGMDTNLFFPAEVADRDLRQTARTTYANSRRICMTCTVRTQCLNQALADGDLDYGMFGALPPTERKEIARIHPPHGTLRRYRTGCECPRCHGAWHAYARTRREARQA